MRATPTPNRTYAIAYYSSLEHQGTLVYRTSSYIHSGPPDALNFDWSFDYYPVAYEHPGPELRLTGRWVNGVAQLHPRRRAVAHIAQGLIDRTA
jgi:hypothetical protein